MGWDILVSTLTHEEKDSADTATRRANLVAHWSASIGGLEWLDDLVASGKAARLSRSGYPNRYTTTVAAVRPLFEGENIERSRFHINFLGAIHKERILACRDDQVLTIDAWDQS